MTISTPKVYRVQLTADDGTLQCKKITTGGYSCTEVAPVTDVSGICIDDSGTVTSMGTTSVKLGFLNILLMVSIKTLVK